MPNSHRPPPDVPSHTVRSLITLGLLIHLICVGVALAGMQGKSDLHRRLTRTLAIYLQTLQLDPGTSWQCPERKIVIEFRPDHKTSSPIQLRDDERFGFHQQRLAKLAGLFAIHKSNQELLATLARSVGNGLLAETQAQSGSLVVRRAADESEDDNLYSARIWLDPAGRIMLLKQIQPPDAAPPAENKTAAGPAT